MVETEEAMQLTDEIVSRPDLFHQYKVQGFNNKRRLQAQYHHETTDDFDSPQISLQQSYHIEGKTNIQYTFFEVISRLFEYTVQGSSVKHRGNHCQGVYNSHSMSSARRNFVYQKAASRDHPTWQREFGRVGLSQWQSIEDLLKIYSRMVERAEAVQLTEQEIVNRPHLFCPHKVQGFNNEQWV